jgi:hypothetical protein
MPKVTIKEFDGDLLQRAHIYAGVRGCSFDELVMGSVRRSIDGVLSTEPNAAPVSQYAGRDAKQTTNNFDFSGWKFFSDIVFAVKLKFAELPEEFRKGYGWGFFSGVVVCFIAFFIRVNI